ncbi:MAG TPA: hypothetical protein VH591_10580 [Ktedonobacterales bacterium]|jgi:hypothetical protein
MRLSENALKRDVYRNIPYKGSVYGTILELAVVVEAGESDAHRRKLQHGSLNLACVSTQEDQPVPKDAQQKLPEGHVAQERLL